MAITYEELQHANSLIKTTPVKGKDYAEVPQRVKAFRSLFPEGTISTEMISNENGVCIFRATVSNGETILGVGTAYEKEDSSYINKTSYIENCETSAVGRALGFSGFGIDKSIASAEEVANAILNQEQDKAAPKGKRSSKKEEPDMSGTIEDTPSAVTKLKAMISELERMGATAFMDELKQVYGIGRVEDIKKIDYRTIVDLANQKYELLTKAKEGK